MIEQRINKVHKVQWEVISSERLLPTYTRKGNTLTTQAVVCPYDFIKNVELNSKCVNGNIDLRIDI